jgi:hypothetical protein
MSKSKKHSTVHTEHEVYVIIFIALCMSAVYGAFFSKVEEPLNYIESDVIMPTEYVPES